MPPRGTAPRAGVGGGAEGAGRFGRTAGARALGTPKDRNTKRSNKRGVFTPVLTVTSPARGKPARLGKAPQKPCPRRESGAVVGAMSVARVRQPTDGSVDAVFRRQRRTADVPSESAGQERHGGAYS